MAHTAMKRQVCRNLTGTWRTRLSATFLALALYLCFLHFHDSHTIWDTTSVLDLSHYDALVSSIEHKTLDTAERPKKISPPKLHMFKPAGKPSLEYDNEMADQVQKWSNEKKKAKEKVDVLPTDDAVIISGADESLRTLAKPKQVAEPAHDESLDSIGVGDGGKAKSESNEHVGESNRKGEAIELLSKGISNIGQVEEGSREGETAKKDRVVDVDEASGQPEYGSVSTGLGLMGQLVAEHTKEEGQDDADAVIMDNEGPQTLSHNDVEVARARAELADTHVGTESHPVPIPATRFLLLRMVGNDLPPKHTVGQAYDNLKFILEYEPDLAECGKVWVVNRIIDHQEETRIVSLLAHHRQVPFNDTAFATLETNFEGYGHDDILRSRKFRKMAPQVRALLQDDMEHQRILYLLNINGVRNTMLDVGRASGAQWILPFDGNTFFTTAGWEALMKEALAADDATKYFAVPMARVVDNGYLLRPSFWPEANEEPQVMFNTKARERFNETLRYGRRSKLPLLARLGVRGPWQGPPLAYIWETYMPFTYQQSDDISPDNPVRNAGWVARLFSSHVENDLAAPEERGLASSQGVQLLLAKAAARAAYRLHGFTHKTLLAFNETVLRRERKAHDAKNDPLLAKTIQRLLSCANHALEQGPWSVVDKLDMPPSRDKHDYYTIKPYFWPNPHTQSGLPYIRIDGKRVPGTELYDEQSDRFDRTRLAALYGNTTCLALAHFFTDRSEYAAKAADNVRHWFLNPATRMSPHTKYSQIQWGENNNLGESTGVIEFKDFYFFLDAVRLLGRARALTADDMNGLREWFREYRAYLEQSGQGQWEYMSPNNHGLYFELQTAAINAFLDDIPRFMRQILVARGRILGQFAADGSLPHEMTRRTQLHYMMFTLQGWYTLARIASHAGVDYWSFKREKDLSPPLKRGGVFTVPYFNHAWKHYQEATTDMQRMLPLYYTALNRYPDLKDRPQARHLPAPQPLYAVKPLFHEHDGIQPFWNLGLTDAYLP